MRGGGVAAAADAAGGGVGVPVAGLVLRCRALLVCDGVCCRCCECC